MAADLSRQLADGANDGTTIGPHSPPLIAASAVSSPDDGETIFSGETQLDNIASTVATSTAPDDDKPNHKGEQEVGEEQGLCDKKIDKAAHDLAYTTGGAEPISGTAPVSGTQRYPTELVELDVEGENIPSSFSVKLAAFKRHSPLLASIRSMLPGNIRSCTPEPDLAPVHGPPEFHCGTQEHDDPLSAQIGLGNHVPRWVPGSVLTYVICTETFLDPYDAVFTAIELAKAISMWKSIGVTFKQVTRRYSAASFRVVYRDLPVNNQKDTLASAFFPNTDHPEERTLHIYALAFTQYHINNQANFLAHEIGHILGFRHEFSREEEPLFWSATWGNRNPNSVMSYYHDSGLWQVQKQDLKELKSFYDSSMKTYKRRPVRNFRPQSSVYT
ncbi:hypothetical protein BGZ61DRAFT_529459 [Ilyonectria robusta]|uniref:uncharacterized protein n=1 Tax=Ilyonectria robusta TaxID=1079257 RepID=UPI001E8E1A74|nr:uncharacterized protein BGZ61DRAFT_529459 [Ilyonectria robusta]KAH8729215.1 hypothetical protein BGZ61DRAFT_529459 [Ilyonectria robusta]